MAEAEFPYMPLYWKDWLTGESTTVMTAEQEGAFLNLLLRAWGSDPPCTLPDDDARLAQLSKLGPKWRRAGKIVRDQFESVGDGRLRNRKQFSVYEELVEHREKRRTASQKGNEARWGKDRKRNPIGSQTESDRKDIGHPDSSPASASASASAENGKQTTGSYEPGAARRGAKPVGSGKPRKPKPPDMTRREFCQQAAPLIRELLWLSRDTPKLLLMGTPGWGMKRELAIALDLVRMYHLTGADVLGMMSVARETLEFGPADALTMRVFIHHQNGPANVRDCLEAWRKRKRIEANDGLEPATFEELAASMRVAR